MLSLSQDIYKWPEYKALVERLEEKIKADILERIQDKSEEETIKWNTFYIKAIEDGFHHNVAMDLADKAMEQSLEELER